MSIISPSNFLRTALESQFAAVFNSNLAAAYGSFGPGIPPYAINFSLDDLSNPDLPQNYFPWNKSIDTVEQKDEPDFPAMCMWIGTGADAGSSPNAPKPSIFAGQITAHWRFWLYVPTAIADMGTDHSSGGPLFPVRSQTAQKLLVPMREATEAALIATLTGLPDSLGFRRDLSWQPPAEGQWMDMAQNLVGWLQEIEFNANFEVQL